MTTHPFDVLMELPTEGIRLDCACLHLARDEYPSLNLLPYVERLDALAAEVADERPGLSAPLRYQALREVLVERHEFRGNQPEYYDPENSYLNRVLDRQTGIPITLSILWLEVARRLKWPAFGVGLPGHFLIRIDDPDRFVLVDPFGDGRSVDVEDCQKLLEHHFDGKVTFVPEFLEPVDARVILARSLNNLRSIHMINHDWPRLELVLQRLAAVEPDNGRHRQELAALRYRVGDVREAYAHLACYLTHRPDAPDHKLVETKLHHLEAAIAALN